MEKLLIFFGGVFLGSALTIMAYSMWRIEHTLKHMREILSTPNKEGDEKL